MSSSSSSASGGGVSVVSDDDRTDSCLTSTETSLEKQLYEIETQMGAIDQVMKALLRKLACLNTSATTTLCDIADTVVMHASNFQNYPTIPCTTFACTASPAMRSINFISSGSGGGGGVISHCSYREAASQLSEMSRLSKDIVALGQEIDAKVQRYKAELLDCHANYLSVRQKWMACITQLHTASDHIDADIFQQSIAGLQ